MVVDVQVSLGLVVVYIVGFDDEGPDVVYIPEPRPRKISLLHSLCCIDSLDPIMHVVAAWVSTVSHCMSFHPDPFSVNGDADFLIWNHQDTAWSINISSRTIIWQDRGVHTIVRPSPL
jgi:hypothetical protein